MAARSGASTVDDRDGHIPIKGMTISMLMFGNMSTTLVCMVAIALSICYSHIRMYQYIEVCIVAINYIHIINL